jgi:molybdenum cofactor cytidylyltransferase
MTTMGPTRQGGGGQDRPGRAATGDSGEGDTDTRRWPAVRPDGGATVGGVLLAAGQSSRFDPGNKLLATLDGVPLVRRAAATLTDSRVAEVVVVTGNGAEAVREALEGLDVTLRHNDSFASGQSSSLHEGVRAARERGWDAVVFALGDMPAVAPGSVDALLDAYGSRSGSTSIFPAAYQGKRGNPVLFDASRFDDLLAVTGDTGGREVILSSDDVELVETDDPGVTRDVDYAADLDRLEKNEE